VTGSAMLNRRRAGRAPHPREGHRAELDERWRCGGRRHADGARAADRRQFRRPVRPEKAAGHPRAPAAGGRLGQPDKPDEQAVRAASWSPREVGVAEAAEGRGLAVAVAVLVA
jgi:hypothetical protein